MPNMMDKYKFAPAEMEQDDDEMEGSDFAHEIQEELPLDPAVVQDEAEEPPEIQALEEALGIEIPREKWDEVMKQIKAQQGMEPRQEETPAPVSKKPVFQSFGNPQNA